MAEIPTIGSHIVADTLDGLMGGSRRLAEVAGPALDDTALATSLSTHLDDVTNHLDALSSLRRLGPSW